MEHPVSRQTAVDALDLSLLIPAYNEEACIAGTVEEAIAALEGLSLSYEVLVIDDGSTDGTGNILNDLAARFPVLRVLTLSPNSGQSAAFGAGFQHCRGRHVVLMDGDGQNDPADIPLLIDALQSCDVCCGYRKVRKDTFSKRIGSRMANAVRQCLLHDGIRDTGCSLKAIKREFVTSLPMNLRGMHRFLPALLIMRGATVVQVGVNHRPRTAGASKYTNLGRLKETVGDLSAVRWMQKRFRRFTVAERDRRAE